ncbi:cutinase family protein [Nocardia nova]|uniref:cutinase family protein n=1 Tax=Nocardia nova TaxID=37330 RepID=UPI001C496736|nr:cutinase family protein [Nocardia nova]MBV7706822.1 cutinase family protein [Nocardia nova]
MIATPTPTAQRGTRPRPPTVVRRLGAAALCAATVLAASVCTVPAVAVAAPQPGCAKVTAVLVLGARDTHLDTDTASAAAAPSSVLDPIARNLQARYGSDLAVRTVPDSPSTSPSPDDSGNPGQDALASLLSSLCPTTRVIVLGYSGGAQIAGDLATLIGHGQGPVPASRILAVGLLGDPRRGSSTPQLGEPAGGQGVEGPRAQDFGELHDRVRTVCARDDLYCSTSPDADPVLTALGRAVSGTGTTPTTPSTLVFPSTTPEPTTSWPTSPDSTPTAPGTIGGLDPSQIIEQVATVLSGLTEFATNLPAIGNDLAQLPGLIVTGNIPALHQVSGDLNNQFAPMVQAVAEVDGHLVARALTLAAPLDTSGWTAIAAQIVSILANLDIARLATDIGQAQEIAWNAVQKLTTGDPAGAAVAVTGLGPIAADLVTTAASTLTGDGGTRLSTLAHTLTTTTTPDTRNALANLTSGIHQNGYTDTTVGPVLDWLSGRIDTAN